VSLPILSDGEPVIKATMWYAKRGLKAREETHFRFNCSALTNSGFLSMNSSSDEKSGRKKIGEHIEIVYDVVVSMEISSAEGSKVDSKRIDFGKLREEQVKGLTDLFSMMAANVEYLKKLAPQFEKLDKAKPPYLQ